MSRYVVGIDLGTSNCAVAYADLESDASPEITVLDIPQLVAPGEVASHALLPSAIYTPAEFELEGEQTRRPWEDQAPERPQPIIGLSARKLGAKTPIRLVESAKSWLCHGGVNRSAAILPWHAPEEIQKFSPLDASALYLGHIAEAWRMAFPESPLAEQLLCVTVPASFDEVARRLTIEAARKAGIGAITLIEEPVASFYAFIARTGGTKQSTGLRGGEQVLVLDVGGGTSDFTLLEVQGTDSDALAFERTAVGEHLLLGGDNMDLALSHHVEPRLSGGKRLDAQGWAQLKLECRIAKEALFENPERVSLPVVVAGRGSKLIGGASKAQLSQEDLSTVVLEGYFPRLPNGREAMPRAKAAAGFHEYGLPYAQDAAITRHLAAFLLKHRKGDEPFARVDAILFNGGALKPTRLRDRVSEAIGDWMRGTAQSSVVNPRALIYDQGDDALELSVARGAAYFGLVRSGRGLRIGGGSPRSFFLGLRDTDDKVLCVAPKGMQDGQQLEVSDREFMLMTNRPASFPLFASTTPDGHAVGEILDRGGLELTELPALQTVVKFGKQKAGTTVPVRIQAKRSELGTLELSCFSKVSGVRFQLEFDLRGTTVDDPDAGAPASANAQPFGGAGMRAPPEAGEVSPAALIEAKSLIDATFSAAEGSPGGDRLMKGLEQVVERKRDEWPLAALRDLSEHLLEGSEARAINESLEARWLNLVGFCLRPGTGFPLDDWRVKQLWRIHAGGLAFPGRDPTVLNWWILWRRVAAGLGRGHQQELSSIVFPLVIPALVKRAKRRPPRPKTQEAVELWRCAASLERVGAKARAQLGDALVDLLEQRKAPRSALWCLGRIGARKLLYGPREATVRASTVAAWLGRLLKIEKLSRDESPVECLLSLGRVTGDRQFDLDEATREAIATYLGARGADEATLRPLRERLERDGAGTDRAFGESLPKGLALE